MSKNRELAELGDKVTVDSGRVGIGTSSPTKELHVEGSVRSHLSDADYSFGTTTSGGGGLFIEPDDYSASNPTWEIRTYASEPLVFQIGGSERMRILSSGGITFNGDTSSSNALDDYEEGTFTPTFVRSTSNPTSTTYNDTWGYYTKIGRVVHISGRIQLSTAGSSGSGWVRIGNLPFTVGGPHDGFTCSLGVVFGSGWSSTNAPRVGFAKINNTFIQLYSGDSADARDTQDTFVGNLSNSCGLIFNCTYNI